MTTTTHSQDIAAELKKVIRLAGRDPEALHGALPKLSAMHRVTSAGAHDEPARVHLILHRLIPEYLKRLPTGRDGRAIRELLTWEDGDGQAQSLTTRYHKAAAHLVYAASDFGRRQEPRLLLECARRFVEFDHDDRLGVAPSAEGTACAEAPATPAAPDLALLRLPVDDPYGGIVRVHPNLDYNQLVDGMADAGEIVILNTWIPGIDILADALVEALQRGTYVSILMLHPDSHVAQLRSEALQAAPHQHFRHDRAGPGIRHCLDVLAAISHLVDDDHKRNLRVRLYNSLPSISVHSIDDRYFVSFFLHGQLAVRANQIEVLGQDTAMGQLVVREMETLWSISPEIDDISRWHTETQVKRVRNLDARPHVTPPAAAATG